MRNAKRLTTQANVTLFTSRRDVGKCLYLDEDGRLAKESVHFGQGNFEVLGFDSVDDLVDRCILSEDFDTRDCLALGLPIKKLDKGAITIKGKERPDKGLISRTRAHFAFAEGPGVLFLDMDDVSGKPMASADSIDAVLVSACPELATVRRIYVPSSSSRICEDGRVLSAKASWHCFMMVEDARDMPDIGRAIFARLIDAGHGHIHITSAGTALLRSPVDDSVWQPERVCYAFGPHFDTGGLYQDCEVFRYGTEPMLRTADAELMADEDWVRWAAASESRARLFEEAGAKVAQARAAWLDEKGVTHRDSYARASAMNELDIDFELFTDKGEAFTVADVFEDPERWHEVDVRHPLEPDITGKSRIYTKNVAFPCVHSFAHGGERFRLVDPEEDAGESFERLARVLKADREPGNSGEAVPDKPVTPVMDLREMLEDLIYLRMNGQVANRRNRTVLSVGGMAQDLSASREAIKNKKVPIFSLWLTAEERVSVDDQSWHPGGPELFSLDGKLVYNTWAGLPGYRAPEDWQARIEPFAEHMAFLVPDDAERAMFMMWLAHMFQKPGELPHTYYCLISLAQGVGRNWLSILLMRIMPGLVTPSVDLSQMMSRGFNGVLSRRLLAVVDEAHEIVEGAHRYQAAKAFRRMITEDYRLIDPKCAPQHTEKNCLRWLLFSNYPDPLPIEDADRRGVFIEGPNKPRSEAYYNRLYGLLKDPAFLASARHYFQTLDISAFNPGARAVRNDMRAQVVEAGKTDLDRAVETFMESWPGWFVLNRDVRHFVHEFIGHDKYRPEQLAHAMRRAGLQTGKSFRLGGKMERVSAVGREGAQRLKNITNVNVEEILAGWRNARKK